MLKLGDGSIVLEIGSGDSAERWEGDAVEIVLEARRIRRRFNMDDDDFTPEFGERMTGALADLGFEQATPETAVQLVEVAEERFVQVVDHIEREVQK